MKIHANSLLFEVTRRCNMICRHCMRGKMQPVDLQKDVVDRVLDSVSHISGLTFTGGEPVLNVPIIRYIVDEIQARGIYVDNFFVVTNGKKFDRDFVDILIDLFDYCDEADIENGLTGLEISQDQFHEEIEVPKMYKALKFFHPDARNKDYHRTQIKNRGNAKINGVGGYNHPPSNWEFQEWGEDEMSVEMLYVAANGNISPDCDVSYYGTDKHSPGNVLREPLVDILTRVKASVEAKEVMV